MFCASSLSPVEEHVARPYPYGELDREPQAHVFSDPRVAWLEVGGELPRISSDSEILARDRVVEPG